MLKLYGFSVSNYFNMVVVALKEKNIEFEIIEVFPNKETNYLLKSPMGKIPCLETEDGFLTETNVILEYLEDRYPEVPLYPADAFNKAKTRELMKYFELYIELPARTLFPGILFGAKNHERDLEQVKPKLESGIAALNQLISIKGNGFLVGDQLTYADIFAFYSFSAANLAAKKIYQWDIFSEVPGLAGLMTRLAKRDSFAEAEQKRQLAWDKYIKI